MFQLSFTVVRPVLESTDQQTNLNMMAKCLSKQPRPPLSVPVPFDFMFTYADALQCALGTTFIWISHQPIDHLIESCDNVLNQHGIGIANLCLTIINDHLVVLPVFDTPLAQRSRWTSGPPKYSAYNFVVLRIRAGADDTFRYRRSQKSEIAQAGEPYLWMQRTNELKQWFGRVSPCPFHNRRGLGPAVESHPVWARHPARHPA